MKEHFPFLRRGLVLSLLLVLVLTGLNRVLVPKYFYNDLWPTTSTFTRFYGMEPESVDVLFLGSSHAVSAFCPQQLYDEYGVCSYNLGSEQQNPLVSYYWLREALRTQKAKVVVLDTFVLFPYRPNEALNATEATTRKAIDYMRWSANKREAVDAICRADSAQSRSSYYFPNIRFHDRWKALGENDFRFGEMRAHQDLMGYSALTNLCGIADYRPVAAGGAETAQMVPLMRDYLDKITALCRENGITLVLVSTPYAGATAGKYETVARYASENGLPCLDFNEAGLYRTLRYDFAADNHDPDHANLEGAEKLTHYIGAYLTNRCGVAARRDGQWDRAETYYQEVLQNAALRQETALSAYLGRLHTARYSVFFAARGDAAAQLDSAQRAALSALGVTKCAEARAGDGFYAVLTDGQAAQACGRGTLGHSGALRDGAAAYAVSSAGADAGVACSILLDGVEYASRQDGLNIVVYDSDMKKVIDAVTFDPRTGSALTRPPLPAH